MNRSSLALALLMAPMLLLTLTAWLMIAQPQTALRIETAALTPDLDRTLKTHIARGKICDPFPCWVELRVDRITLLEEPAAVSAIGIPFRPSDQLLVSGTCPPGAHLIEGAAQDPWWARYIPFTSTRWLAAEPFTLCLTS